MSYSRLFSPMSLRPLALANRLVHTATLTNYAARNLPTERHAEYYGARGRGGVGLIAHDAVAAPSPSMRWSRSSRHGLHPRGGRASMGAPRVTRTIVQYAERSHREGAACQ